MLRHLLRAVGLASALVVAPSAYAAEYYVAPNGFDTNPGTSAMPFLTIQRAANAAGPGDRIVVRPGTYAGARFSTSGTAALPIVVEAEPGAVVTAPGPLNANGDNLWVRNASWVTIVGFEIHSAARSGIAVQAEPDAESHGVRLERNHCHDNGRWGIFTAYAEGIQILDNECSYSGIEHGIYVSNSSDNPVIRGNRCHHNNDSGVQINADPALPGDGIVSNAEISYNVIWENGVGGAAGINLASVVNSRIFNNLLYENHASGIAGWDDGFDPAFGTHHNEFSHNTVVMASNGRWAISLSNGSSHNTIRNNILIHPGSRGSIEVDASSETGLASDYNLVVNRFSVDDVFITAAAWQGRGHDAHAVVSSSAAVFVAPGTGDYHLKLGGPAIDMGVAIAAIGDDVERRPRPRGLAPDAGALESQGGETAGVFQGSSATWFLKNALAPGNADETYQFGLPSPSYMALVGDWNGDGVDTAGLYDSSSGTFFLRNAHGPGNADLTFVFGVGGASRLPVVGDWDGDGDDTIGLFDTVSGTFFLKNSNASGVADVTFTYGPPASGWRPLAGDWNNDRRTTVGLYDPASATFFLKNSNAPGNADVTFVYGFAGATPVAGDWDGNNTATVGIYQPSTGTWFLRNANGSGVADVTMIYGPPMATPLTGDWDGR
jgi:hypothetical protein